MAGIASCSFPPGTPISSTTVLPTMETRPVRITDTVPTNVRTPSPLTETPTQALATSTVTATSTRVPPTATHTLPPTLTPMPPTLTPIPIRAQQSDVISYLSVVNDSAERFSTIRLDGTQQTLLEWSNLPSFLESDPAIADYFLDYAWSPNGTQLAVINPAVQNRRRYGVLSIINADGSGLRRLTGPELSVAWLDWSPDGSKVVFSGFDTKEEGLIPPDLYVIDVRGSELKRLTFDGGYGQPRWSPDSQRIAFELSPGRTEPFGIYVMNADGSGKHRLTPDTSPSDPPLWRSNQGPTWSPDGTQIAFYSYRDGNSEIYVMNADGSQPVRLTFNDATDDSPVWSLDGKRIAFISNRDGNFEIYVVNADGSNQIRLTNDPVYERDPAWRP